MASSSSSSLINHEVFLSFRGIDTRNTFTSHLHTALTDAGIRTFLDDVDLQPGKDISSSLLSTIEQSRMTIIVFSKNYASSKWCLDELLHMVECKRKVQDYLIYPIFYDVDPAHVRHQISSFGDAFAKHKDTGKVKCWGETLKAVANQISCSGDAFAKYKETDQVKSWREALKAVANLSGWHLQNNAVAKGNEAKLIKEIVKEVMSVVKKYTTLNVAMHLVGMDSRVEDVLSRISKTVRLIGIYGMGGAGKTTIAKAIYNTLIQQFEYNCFLANVSEVSNRPGGLAQLQEKLLSSDPMMKNLNVDSVDRGITLIKERLCSKQLLLVLDDLDSEEQVDSLVGDREWFGSKSIIIITTRDVRILHLIGVDVKYEPVLLNDTESSELFSRHAFRKSINSKDFFEISNRIVSYCGGLPLALVVLGSYLKGRTIEQWEDALKELQQIPHDKIQEKLKINFNGLDSNAQAIFLDITCFFIGVDQDYAISVLDACGLFPKIGISTLREKCLLTIDKGNELRMHDHLREMGRRIVREKFPQEPGKHSRLWDEKDIIDVLKNDKGTELVEGITLYSSICLKFRTQAFIRMKNLRLLEINNTHLTGSFENIFKELRWLHWGNCPLKCLPSSFHPEMLVGLYLQESSLNILWKDTMVLENLKVLDLSRSEDLKRTPDFTEVPMLERLILDYCSSLIEIHPSIGLLSRLVCLSLKYCGRLTSLPLSIFNLRSLQYLNLLGRRKINFDQEGPLCSPPPIFLPSSVSSLCSLEYLNLARCGLTEGEIPNDIGSLSSLKFLDLSGNYLLCSLPSSLGQLSNLTRLSVRYCKNIQSLPEGLIPPNLETLSLGFCKSLRSLPELPPNLENLDANNCTSLEKIPNLKCLQSLRGLNLERCSNLAEIQGLDNLLHSSLSLLSLRGSTNLAETATALIESLIWRNFEFCPGFVLHLPPTEIPYWFRHQAMGSSISFDIPFTSYNMRSVVGFTIWGVERRSDYRRRTSVVIINKRNGSTWRHELAYFFPSSGAQSWVTYIGREDTIQDGDTIQISTSTLGIEGRDGIGVHLAYAN